MFLLALLFAGFFPQTTPSLPTLRIRVVESKHLRPVSDECLNISLGKRSGGALFLPTDSNGEIVLQIDGDKVSAPLVPLKACNSESMTGPFSSPQRVLAILPDVYRMCQQWPGGDNWPSYSIDDIMRAGIATDNTCTQQHPVAHPGELVLVVRKSTFWEGMRS